jgi:hypothetical protein
MRRKIDCHSVTGTASAVTGTIRVILELHLDALWGNQTLNPDQFREVNRKKAAKRLYCHLVDSNRSNVTASQAKQVKKSNCTGDDQLGKFFKCHSNLSLGTKTACDAVTL